MGAALQGGKAWSRRKNRGLVTSSTLPSAARQDMADLPLIVVVVLLALKLLVYVILFRSLAQEDAQGGEPRSVSIGCSLLIDVVLIALGLRLVALGSGASTPGGWLRVLFFALACLWGVPILASVIEASASVLKRRRD